MHLAKRRVGGKGALPVPLSRAGSSSGAEAESYTVLITLVSAGTYIAQGMGEAHRAEQHTDETIPPRFAQLFLSWCIVSRWSEPSLSLCPD